MALDSDKAAQHEEFVTLFVRHEAAIHSFVLTLLPDLTAAEDIVQQASLTMWRRFDQFQPGTSFRNWAFQVAKFTAMNHLTKMRRDRHVFSEKLLDMLAQQAENRTDELDERRRALNTCIETLGDEDRHVVTGCYREGTTIKAFAQSVGRTPNVIYKRLNRIRGALLKCIERRLRMEGSA